MLDAKPDPRTWMAGCLLLLAVVPASGCRSEASKMLEVLREAAKSTGRICFDQGLGVAAVGRSPESGQLVLESALRKPRPLERLVRVGFLEPAVEAPGRIWRYPVTELGQRKLALGASPGLTTVGAICIARKVPVRIEAYVEPRPGRPVKVTFAYRIEVDREVMASLARSSGAALEPKELEATEAASGTGETLLSKTSGGYALAAPLFFGPSVGRN